MENVKITFQTIPEDTKPSNGFQYVNCLMVFDIKMEGFCREAFLVVGGHMTHTPDTITYSSVDMRENVLIVFTMVALHHLGIKAADILNIYVTASKGEKI